ncbi:MAG: hypothetical protein M1818_005579 [Claussenomyces sp. TS43310]|nr:MAG: hypothetical protein M1818_005579 [Claussenomyces sp. TS43310]
MSVVEVESTDELDSQLDTPKVMPSFRKRKRASPGLRTQHRVVNPLPRFSGPRMSAIHASPPHSRLSSHANIDWGGNSCEARFTSKTKKQKVSQRKRNSKAFWRSAEQVDNQHQPSKTPRCTGQLSKLSGANHTYEPGDAHGRQDTEQMIPDDRKEQLSDKYWDNNEHSTHVAKSSPEWEFGQPQPPLRPDSRSQPYSSILRRKSYDGKFTDKGHQSASLSSDRDLACTFAQVQTHRNLRILPEDHPLKRELADVKSAQLKRQDYWADMIIRTGPRWKETSSKLRCEEETRIGATKRDELVSMIAKLEMGATLQELGTNSSSLVLYVEDVAISARENIADDKRVISAGTECDGATPDMQDDSLFVSDDENDPPIAEALHRPVMPQQRWLHQGDRVVVPRRNVASPSTTDQEREFDEAEEARECERQLLATVAARLAPHTLEAATVGPRFEVPASLVRSSLQSASPQTAARQRGLPRGDTAAALLSDSDFVNIDDDQSSIEVLDLTGDAGQKEEDDGGDDDDDYDLRKSDFETIDGAEDRVTEPPRGLSWKAFVRNRTDHRPRPRLPMTSMHKMTISEGC